MTTYIPARLVGRYSGDEYAYSEYLGLLEGSKNQIDLIVAPYGQGKTRLCQELYSDLVDCSSIKLEHFRCKDLLTKSSPLEEIKRKADSHDYVVIIDALDELTNLKILEKIFDAFESKIRKFVVTCRTTFLDTIQDTICGSDYSPTLINFLQNHDIVLYDLQEFTKEEGRTLLIKSGIPESRVDAIESSNIWSKISSHPLWLNILVQVYDEGDAESIANLWELMGKHIEQIDRKSRLDEGLLRLAYRDTALAIAASEPVYFDKVTGIDREYWTLVEKSGKSIAFKHRIFYDYFIVEAVSEEIETKEYNILTRVLLNDVQIQLLSDALSQYGYLDLTESVLSGIEKINFLEKDYIGANIISLLRFREQDVSNFVSSYPYFHSADLRNLKLNNINATDTCFKNSFLAESDISNSNFIACNFEGTDFGDKVGVVDLDRHGDLICCVTHTGTVFLLTIENQNLNIIRKRKIVGATACSINPQGVVLGFQGGAIQLYDKLLQPISSPEPRHTDKVMDISSSENTVVSCACDGTLGIWDKKTGSQMTQQVHSDIGHGIDFYEGRESVITVSYDGRLVASSFRSGKIVKEAHLSKKSVYSCKFNPSGTHIAVGGFGAEFFIVDTNSFKPLSDIKSGHKSTIWCVEWLNEYEVAITGWDSAVSIFNIKTGETRYVEFPCYNSKCLLHETGLLVSSALTGSLALLDTHSGEVLSDINLDQMHDINFNNVTFQGCFGLSPQRNDLLRDAGATVIEPVEVTVSSFVRKKGLFDRFTKMEIPKLKEKLEYLSKREDGIYVFDEMFDDISIKSQELHDSVAELLGIIRQENFNNPELLNELEVLEKQLTEGNHQDFDYEKLLTRLSQINGASALLMRSAQGLQSLIYAIFGA